MPINKGKHRAHTPIVSQAETRFFGRELSEKEAGDGSRSDMSVAEIERHLEERRGKDLPEKVKGGGWDGASHRAGGYRAKR
jgi:hypothetical protein